MAIIHEILDSLENDAPVIDVSVCLRVTAVLSRRLGLAYSFPRELHMNDRHGKRPKKRLFEMSARELATLALSEDLTETSVGVAAINSLLEPEERLMRDGKAHDLILERGAGKKVTLVGHFPFVDKLREGVGQLWVLEKEPREGDLPAEEASRVIPKSDIVAITGTALINRTLEDLLELARGRYTIVLGPTTVLSPILFDAGVDAICGSVVTDPDLALRCVREGSSFRHVDGLRPVIMER
jgi:hypothetical protein